MSVSFKSVDEVLDFAIQEEQNAVRLYQSLAAQVDNPAAKRTLEAFAEEERGHQAKLEAVRAGAMKLTGTLPEVAALGLSEAMTETDATAEMDYADVLVLAMRKEKAAYRMYSVLAAEAACPEVAAIFRDLAAEEANHKVRFEIEYDDRILKQR